MKSKVALVKVSPRAGEARLKEAVAEMIGLLGGMRGRLGAGKRVLVKPNFGTVSPKMSVNPRLVAATLSTLSEGGCKTLMGEDPVPMYSEARIYKKWKLAEMAERTGADLVSVRHGPHQTVKPKKPLYFKQLEVSRIALDVDAVVSLAKMKHVPVCLVSLSLKNMKGLLAAEWKRRFHCEGLEKGIVDLNQAVRPALAIIDATHAYDMVTGKNLPVGLLIGSKDPVAADAVCTRIMGFDPMKVEYIRLAEKVGLGAARKSRIEILGESPDDFAGTVEFSGPASPFDLIKGSGIRIVQGDPCCACLNELGRELKA